MLCFSVLHHHAFGEDARARAAVFLRHLKPRQPGGAGLVHNLFFKFRRQQRQVGVTALGLAADHQRLVRNQLARGKARRALSQHAQFFGEFKVHGSCSAQASLISSALALILPH